MSTIQLSKMRISELMSKIVGAIAIFSLTLFTLMGTAQASSHTAVTAELVNFKMDDNLLICQYQTMADTHFKVLVNTTTCPSSMLVGHKPMLTDEEHAQIEQMFSAQK